MSDIEINDYKNSKSIEKTLILTFLIYFFYIIVLSIFILTEKQEYYGLSRYIPGDKFVDISIIIFLPIFVNIITLFLAYFCSPIFISFAKILKSNQYQVAVQKVDNKINKWDILRRSFYASLFAFSISLFVNNILYSLGIEFIEDAEMGYSVAALSSLISPISVLFMFQTWFLEDCGIVFFKKRNLKETTEMVSEYKTTFDIASIGSFYGMLLRGFAGVSTPILYVYVFLTEINRLYITPILVLLLVLPFVLIGFYSITQHIYLKMLKRLKEKFIQKRKLNNLYVVMVLD